MKINKFCFNNKSQDQCRRHATLPGTTDSVIQSLKDRQIGHAAIDDRQRHNAFLAHLSGGHNAPLQFFGNGFGVSRHFRYITTI